VTVTGVAVNLVQATTSLRPGTVAGWDERLYHQSLGFSIVRATDHHHPVVL